MIRAFININKVLIVLPIRLAIATIKAVVLLPLAVIKSFGGAK
jgi:hypothetical protein|nr:MAG TPA_asm: hypothetical protein [Bacteriophage sp.]